MRKIWGWLFAGVMMILFLLLIFWIIPSIQQGGKNLNEEHQEIRFEIFDNPQGIYFEGYENLTDEQFQTQACHNMAVNKSGMYLTYDCGENSTQNNGKVTK